MQTQTALILLPIEYNPDKKGKRQRIPIKDFQKTAVEISKNFDLGCTLDLYPKHGIWVKLGTVHKDVNVILEIDNLPKTEEKRLIKYCLQRKTFKAI